MGKIVFLVAVMLAIVLLQETSFALEVETHEAINYYIANSTLDRFSLGEYLKKNCGLSHGIAEKFNGLRVDAWLGIGGKYEDIPPKKFSLMTWLPYMRSTNHFHDPITNKGFSGFLGAGILSGVSSLQWAQWPLGNQTWQVRSSGNYSWFDVRDYFYKALTSADKTTRDRNFADTFRGLGQVMHLVEDVSVPEHTRNDAHGTCPQANHYECWAKVNITKDTLPNYPPIYFDPSAIGNSNPLAPVPIANLFDTNQYGRKNPAVTLQSNVGLSEFTNANFFSQHTIFKNYLHPTKENTTAKLVEQYAKDGTPDKVWYVQGYTSQRLAAYSYLFKYDTALTAEWEYNLDDFVYEDYASQLIPRAVGYSAGLLNYFFRGDMRLSYETGSTPGYVIINNTPEKMEGEFGLYYDTADGTRYPLWKGTGWIGPNGDKISIGDLIPPADAKEPGKCVVVFKGKMGNEDGAVAGYVMSRLLEITPPSEFVYSMVDADEVDPHFTEIKTKVSNKNAAEAIQNGTLQAVAKYKADIDDTEFIYAISKPVSIGSLSSAEVSFDFSSNPIPVDATDLYLYIIFKGQIGNESNAVAIGVKDISEPTPVDLFNNMDRVCINKSWYAAGSATALNLAGVNSDAYAHDVKDIYIRFSAFDNKQSASPENYAFYVDSLGAGDSARTFYILADYKFGYSVYDTWKPITGVQEPWTHINELFTHDGTAVRNQTDFTNDKTICGDQSPCFDTRISTYYDYRDFSMWWGSGQIFINRPYPQDSICQ